ncbi:MAG: hypothetical protein L6R37_001105 [Teloschistes peruensis]|nr:MAG: hypothetical protein L6R37_001105 [Teloschistes peruensis]
MAATDTPIKLGQAYYFTARQAEADTGDKLPLLVKFPGLEPLPDELYKHLVWTRSHTRSVCECHFCKQRAELFGSGGEVEDEIEEAKLQGTTPWSPLDDAEQYVVPFMGTRNALSAEAQDQDLIRAALASKTPQRSPPTPEETDILKVKKSWEVALAPAKQLPMNAIMMYMSGNSLQIFSIMMVFMLFKNPIQGLLQTNQAFVRYETPRTKGKMWLVKAVYVLMNLVALALGVWKVNGMGLLPTTRSDWLAWETQREPLERAIFAF